MSGDRLDALRSLAERSPDDPRIRYGLARELLKARRWEEAAEHFRAATREDPDFTAAYVGAGEAWAEAGRRDDAREILREGMEAAERTGATRTARHMARLLRTLDDEPEDDGGTLPSATTPLDERTPPERPVELRGRDGAGGEGATG